MSTITIKYPPSKDPDFHKTKQDVRERIIETTAQTLSVDPKGVIVDFAPWGEPIPEEAPTFLFRAETSVRRRKLLKPWAAAILKAAEQLIDEGKLPAKNGERVAVKPYVLDSEWIETSR